MEERKRQNESPLPLIAAPLVASLLGTLQFRRKEGKKYWWREGRAWMCSKEGAVLSSLSRSHIFPWVWGRAGFLSNDPISFLALPRSWALPQSHPFPDFPRLVPSPFMISILALTAHASWFCFSFGFHCTFT